MASMGRFVNSLNSPVLEAVQSLPDDSSLQRITEELQIMAAVRRGPTLRRAEPRLMKRPKDYWSLDASVNQSHRPRSVLHSVRPQFLNPPIRQFFNFRFACRASAIDALIRAIEAFSKCAGSSSGFTCPESDSR